MLKQQKIWQCWAPHFCMATRDWNRRLPFHGMCLLWFATVSTTPCCIRLAVLPIYTLNLVLVGISVWGPCLKMPTDFLSSLPLRHGFQFCKPFALNVAKTSFLILLHLIPAQLQTASSTLGATCLFFKNLILCILPSFLPRGPGEVNGQSKVSVYGIVSTAFPQWLPLFLSPPLATTS